MSQVFSSRKKNTEHCELEKIIYGGFMQEAYKLGVMPEVLSWKPGAVYVPDEALNGTEADILNGICMEIRGDYGNNGSLINRAIGEGRLYRLMKAFLSYGPWPAYTLDYVKARAYTQESAKVQGKETRERIPGACYVRHDAIMKKWLLQIQLDSQRLWFLSVFVREDGSFEKYSLDKETAEDSHYEFVEERKIRNSLYTVGDESRYFHEILIRYAEAHGGNGLLNLIRPYITAQFHYE